MADMPFHFVLFLSVHRQPQGSSRRRGSRASCCEPVPTRLQRHDQKTLFQHHGQRQQSLRGLWRWQFQDQGQRQRGWSVVPSWALRVAGGNVAYLAWVAPGFPEPQTAVSARRSHPEHSVGPDGVSAAIASLIYGWTFLSQTHVGAESLNKWRAWNELDRDCFLWVVVLYDLIWLTRSPADCSRTHIYKMSPAEIVKCALNLFSLRKPVEKWHLKKLNS